MSLCSLAGPASFEIPKVKGSRFLARAAPLAAEEGLRGLLEEAREALPGATHHAWAYRLGAEGSLARAGDDGEPRGSAGAPILREIRGRHLTGVAVVVSRVFGGTKLGVGGLARAYGDAAAQVLERATLIEVVVSRRIAIRYPYACEGAVQSLLAAEGLAPLSSGYAEEVLLELEVPAGRLEAFLAELGERTAGRSRHEPL